MNSKKQDIILVMRVVKVCLSLKISFDAFILTVYTELLAVLNPACLGDCRGFPVAVGTQVHR